MQRSAHESPMAKRDQPGKAGTGRSDSGLVLKNSSQMTVRSPDFFLPFADGNFLTASGKAELYSEALEGSGFGSRSFTSNRRANRGTVQQAKAFPLELLARKADNFLNSSFSNLPTFRRWRNWACWR